MADWWRAVSHRSCHHEEFMVQVRRKMRLSVSILEKEE
tara:strand:+ start:28 stop:141 length:114 start_codon:yes stop_codon:yes gene_type:complete